MALLTGLPLAAQIKIGPQVPLSLVERVKVRGSFVAAGGGARNVGETDINLNLTSSAKIKKAYLYWAVMRNVPEIPPGGDTVTFNGKSFTGEVAGTSGDACWPRFNLTSGFSFDVFRADVTNKVKQGTNRVRNIPSGLTDGTPPSDPSALAAFPLADGASLFVIFEHPDYDCNDVALYDGAQTFGGGVITETLDEFTVAHSNGDAWFSHHNDEGKDGKGGKGGKGGKTDPNPEDAKTVYIVADGQARFAGKQALFDGMVVVPDNAFSGADGAAPVDDPADCLNSTDPNCDGLWDTLNVDVSDKFVPGVPQLVNVAVDAGNADCVTWVAQGLAVKTMRLEKKGKGGHDDDDDHYFSKSSANEVTSGAGGLGDPSGLADNTWGLGGSNKRGGKKVDLCHVSSGNPNGQTINISESAVDSHLKNHRGDYLGECSLSHVCQCDSSGGNNDNIFGHDDDDDGGRKGNGCAGNN